MRGGARPEKVVLPKKEFLISVAMTDNSILTPAVGKTLWKLLERSKFFGTRKNKNYLGGSFR